ncbi:LPS-assembly protein [Rhodothalassium salexigens DSM 2132]|uniref:LPS-assembly protein LptD n=1 Tax=Rhodothalassium salexigens DSM 2132 TaxID=1188247 RepID=A0A4R2PRH0_RHOSA|nr:LPS assembly protein LptD [Rhodothalassium salexigens]MBB4210265.1 LPS-assembly protein [Rhodothalassium salexigens DSM 2132]MBK1638785.1 hypothetical protein [Rhodothalassium salexigens DSM 2132]TCP38429.1 LPS-assembly protein [Rhodothalassium salexigens DSM 2132]
MPRQHPRSRPLRRALLAAATALASGGMASAGPVEAAPLDATPLHATPGPIPELPQSPAERLQAKLDSLGDDVTFSARRLTYEPAENKIYAEGRVRVEQNGYVLEAGALTYDRDAGTITARDGVRITDPDGNLIAADRAVVADSLAEGTIENVTLLLEDGSRARAATGERLANGDVLLDRAVYSPCVVCQGGDTPAWRLKAASVVHDKSAKRIVYRNATLDVFGVSVAPLPYLSHPDPTVKRASGLLVPEVGQRNELGLYADIPFHWAISDRQDFTGSTLVSTREAPIAIGEYRRHLGFGRLRAGGSLTYDTDAEDATGQDTANGEFRGHFYSNGRFVLSDAWSLDHQIQWASDDTFLRRTGLSDADTLVTSFDATGAYGRSSVRARGFAFQGLRVEDVAGRTPFILPLVNAEWVSDPGFLAGTARLSGNVQLLTRTGGQDSRRISAGASWTRRLTSDWGHVVRLDAQVRGDLYDVRDADRPDLIAEAGGTNPFAGRDGTHARGLARAGMTVSWPFVSSRGGVRQVIEPIVQGVAAPQGLNDTAIPNEDSRAFELSTLNLFDLNRTPGLDAIDSGSRLTYGLKYRVLTDLLDLQVMAGHSLRTEATPAIFADGTGLGGTASDIVAGLEARLGDRLDLVYRGQLDNKTLEPELTEVETRLDLHPVTLNAGYLRIDRDLVLPDRPDREEVRIDGQLAVTDHWTLFGGIIRDLSDRTDIATIEYETGVVYSNCCFELSLGVRDSNIIDRDVDPGTSFILRLRLKSLE